MSTHHEEEKLVNVSATRLHELIKTKLHKAGLTDEQAEELMLLIDEVYAQLKKECVNRHTLNILF